MLAEPRPDFTFSSTINEHAPSACCEYHFDAARALDVAWAEAEAAHVARRSSGFPLSVTSKAPLSDDYTAAAAMEQVDAPTPATALRALTGVLEASRDTP